MNLPENTQNQRKNGFYQKKNLRLILKGPAASKISGK
jgi:hypothetical protein